MIIKFLENKCRYSNFGNYIRLILEFNSSVLNTGKLYLSHSNTIEMVQRHFTKRLFCRCRLPNSVPHNMSRLNFLNIDSLFFRRTFADLVLVHYIIVGNMDFNMGNFVVGQPSSSRVPNIKLRLSQCRTNIYLNSFNNRIVHKWNSLSCSISSIESKYSVRN